VESKDPAPAKTITSKARRSHRALVACPTAPSPNRISHRSLPAQILQLDQHSVILSRCTHPSQCCHLERNVVIGEAEDKVESKDPVPVKTITSKARRSHRALVACPAAPSPNPNFSQKSSSADSSTRSTLRHLESLYPSIPMLSS
jgi:hypothetical protein